MTHSRTSRHLLKRWNYLDGRWLTAAATALAFAAAGCSDPMTAGEVSMSAKERPDVDRAMVDQGALRLPAGQAFNIRVFTSQQTGDGRGESTPQGEDGVVCKAVSGEKGTATAAFQLGYAFDNVTEKPLDAEIRIRLDYSESITESVPATTTAPASQLDGIGQSGISFLIRDSNGATIKSEAINANHPIHGLRGSKATHEQTFDARFEPSLGYYIFLSGMASAAATAAHRAEVKLEVSKYSLEIKWQPADRRRAAREPALEHARAADSSNAFADVTSGGDAPASIEKSP